MNIKTKQFVRINSRIEQGHFDFIKKVSKKRKIGEAKFLREIIAYYMSNNK